MGTTKNILMQEFNGVDYNILYPSIQPDFPNDLANMYIWKKWKKDFTQTETIIKSTVNVEFVSSTTTQYIAASDEYEFLEESQTYSLISPQSYSIRGTSAISYMKQYLEPLARKYVIAYGTSSGYPNLYGLSRNETSGVTTGSLVYKMPSNIENLTIAYRNKAYVFTGEDSSQYSNGKYTLTYYGYDLTPTHTPPTDEYSRDDLGVLCDKGFYRSYVGTNTQTTLTIPVPFQPNIMLLSKDNINLSYTYDSQLIWIRGVGTYFYSNRTDTSIALDGNNLLLTLNTSQSNAHYNGAGTVYYYWIR